MKLTATLDSATRLASRRWHVGEVDRYGIRHNGPIARVIRELLDVKAAPCITSNVLRPQFHFALDGSLLVTLRCSWGACNEIATVGHLRPWHAALPPDFRVLCRDCAGTDRRVQELGLNKVEACSAWSAIVMPSLELVQQLEFAFAILARLGGSR